MLIPQIIGIFTKNCQLTWLYFSEAQEYNRLLAKVRQEAFLQKPERLMFS